MTSSDTYMFGATRDFTLAEVQQWKNRYTSVPGTVKPMRKGTVGTINKSFNTKDGKTRDLVLVRVYSHGANGWEESDDQMVPWDHIRVGARLGQFSVDDPHTGIILPSNVGRSVSSQDPDNRFSAFVNELIAQMVNVHSDAGAPSNAQTLTACISNPQVLSYGATHGQRLTRYIIEGMRFLRTFPMFAQGMPQFDTLWTFSRAPSDYSQISKPILDRIKRSSIFYVILYRNDHGERAVYVGRTKDYRSREMGHAYHLTSPKTRDLQHYRIARSIMRKDSDWKFIPFCAIDRNVPQHNYVVRWTEQLFILLFESYNQALLSGIITDTASVLKSGLLLSWSHHLSKTLADMVKELKARPQFESFKWTGLQDGVRGCNWQSPLLENVWTERRLTRMTIHGEDGQPKVYQFRGLTRRLQGTSMNPSCVLFMDRDEGRFPRSMPCVVPLRDCPGLKRQDTVHVVIEIMVNPEERHPTPFLPVPSVGPFDIFGEAARLAIKIEWLDKDKDKWMSTALSAAYRTSTVADHFKNRKTTKDYHDYGEQAAYLPVRWVQCLKLMSTLMKWTWKAAGRDQEWVKLLEPWMNVKIRSQDFGFVDLKYTVRDIPVTQRQAPVPWDMEDTAYKIDQKFGRTVAIGSCPPGFFAGHLGAYSAKTRQVSCDMSRNRAKVSTETNQREVTKHGTRVMLTCQWCEPLRRYCTFTKIPPGNTHDDIVPGLTWAKARTSYGATQVSAPPVDIDLLNTEEEDLEEALEEVKEDMKDFEDEAAE